MGGFSFPQSNPTGVTGSGFFNTATGFGTPGTGTGGPGTMNFGNTMNPNPTPQASQNPGGTSGLGGASSTDPFTGTVTGQGGSTTASQNPYGLSQSQANWMEDYLQKTYGGGMGALIYQYLQSNGGYNSALTGQVVGATTNAMQQQTQLGADSLSSTLSAEGVSGSSSSMGDALGAYENQAVAQENQITSQDYYQMWAESQQNELNALEFAATGTAKTLANKPNWMDYASAGMQVAGSIAAPLLFGV